MSILLRIRRPLRSKQIRDARPSPDGSRIAFTALDRLHVAELPDGEPRRLTDDEVGEFHPAWSPDGRFIAYVTWDDDSGEGHIRRVPGDGGTSQTLTSAPGFYQQAVWSPNGDRIVAMRSARRNVQEAIDPFIGAGLDSYFIWIPASGGDVTVIGPTAGRSSPHFTADPERIYYYGFAQADPVPGSPSQGPPAVALTSARWDDTEVKLHLQVLSRFDLSAGGLRAGYQISETSDLVMPQVFEDEQPRELIIRRGAGSVIMAPQGDQAFAQIGRDMYVVTVPDLGATLPVIDVFKPDSAAVPVRKLNELGAEFPAWSADGRSVHWSLGNGLFTYDLDAAAGDDDYEATEQRIEVTAPRDIPRGTVVLRGARAITMNGNEVIEDADIVVTDNRIISVTAGRRGGSRRRRGD